MTSFYFIDQILIFLIIISGIYIALWVYFVDRKSKVNQFFFLFTITLLLYITFSYLSHNPNQFYQALLWKKLFLIMVAIFFICTYFLFIYIIKEERKYKILSKIVIIVETSFIFLIIFTDSIIKDVEIQEWGTNIVWGWIGKNVWFGTMIPFTLLFIGLLLRKYYKSSAKERLRVEYFLSGIIFFTFMNLIFNVGFPLINNTFQYYKYGDYSAVPLFISFAYAITNRNLIGIKPLITQILIAIISIILLVDLFLLSDDLTMQLLKAGILIAFLYFSRGMVESVKKEKKAREELEETYKKIDQYVRDLENINVELEEKNEDLEALLKASDATAGVLDPEKIAQNIVDSIPVNLDHLGYKGGIIVLYNKEKETAHTYAMTESDIVKKAKKLLNKPFKKYSEPIDTDNLVIKTIKTKEMQVGSKLEDFIAPTVNANICKMIQKLVKAKSFISIPIFSSGRIVGAIIFVGVKPEKEITQRDKDILFGFSSHIGAAIENAELYKKTNRQMKEMKKLNISLKNANQKLEELLKMKNEFLHITSHQLRTPLTAIRGMISMWYEGNFDNLSKRKKREMLKNICVSAERLNNITNDMLDALELEGGVFKFQFKQVSLEKIIKEAINTLKFNYDKKGLYINFNMKSKNMPNIEAEPNYIRQIFLNLIDNACKYTNKGGTDISIKKSGKYAEIIVKDTGIGVSKKDQKKIFQKFTRSKEAITENASGSGLGLFIVKKIIKAHYGKIEFYSEGKGKGSTVKIYLPVKQE